ncbi:hypothetical protein HN992_02960 [Candidatus Woesearchaeota archaeon]|jgi:RPA family protein|nr:hypothetical protein [Candidatus Woesearchaeota archaeon]
METTKQPIQRQIAKKLWLSSLDEGTFHKGSRNGDEFIASYLEMEENRVSRVNILATVVDVFKSEDGNYFSFTLDDATGTIRIKAFNEDTAKLTSIEKGDLVLVVGKLREYQEELYIAPEITKKVTDPNSQLIRRAELLATFGKPKIQEISKNTQIVQTKISTPQQKSRDESHEKLRHRILEVLTDHEDTGAELSIISKKIAQQDSVTEGIVKELLLEGEIYENKPGHFKTI